MSRYKLHIGHCIFAISGFAYNQPVWSRRQLKIHNGPTIELTIAFPHDPTKRFHIPYPVTRDMLRKLVAREGGILWPNQLKILHDRLEEFANDVVNNHGWFRPYRPFSSDFEDCVAVVWSVTAVASAGEVGAEEFVVGWF